MIEQRSVAIKFGNRFCDTGRGACDKGIYPSELRGQFPKDKKEKKDGDSRNVNDDVFLLLAAQVREMLRRLVG